VGQVFINHRRGDLHSVWVQNGPADQREVFATDQQHFLQFDTIPDIWGPVTVYQHQVVVGDFELLTAYMYDSKQSVIVFYSFVDGLYYSVGKRFVCDRIVDNIFLTDWC